MYNRTYMNKYILIGFFIYLVFATTGCIAPSGYKWVKVNKGNDNWMKPKTRHIGAGSLNYGQDITPAPFPWESIK